MIPLLFIFIAQIGVYNDFTVNHPILLPEGHLMEGYNGIHHRFDSLNIRFVGNWPFGSAYTVAYDTARNLCFLSSGGGVYILDISQPTNPIEVSRIKTQGGEILGLVYLDNMLYISDWTYGFEIWDVANPNVPTRIGGCEIQGGSILGDGAWGLAVSPPYAYVVSKDSGLVVVDITNPTIPFEVARCYLHGQCTNIALSGNYAYVCWSQYGTLAVIDISDPLNPVVIGQSGFLFPPVDVAVTDSFAYIGGLSYYYLPNFAIVDISTPSNPTILVQSLFGDNNWGICAGDSLVYLASRYEGLKIVNVIDPYNPSLVGSCYTPDLARDVSIIDTMALVADFDAGVRIINVSNPSNPNEIGFYDTPGFANNLVVNCPYVYLFDGYSGIYILDITELHNQIEIGHFENPMSDFSFNGELQYPFLYVADVHNFRILNVSVPSNPVQVGACSTYCLDAAVKDTFAFLATGSAGLTVVNISDPSNPYIVATDTTGEARVVVVNGNYAYTINDITPWGFWVYDITNPLSPVQVGYYNSGESYTLAIKDTFAFIGTTGGLIILNIANPSNPVFVSSYSTGIDRVYGLSVTGYYVLLSVSDIITNHIKIIDISNINNPLEAGFYTTPRTPHGIAILDTLILVSNASNGLNIYTSPLLTGIKEGEFSTPPYFLHLEVCPNPFRNHLVIKFQIPKQKGAGSQKSVASIKIYDISGRLVKSFSLTTDNCVLGTIVWDGTDDSGYILPSGVYFIRLQVVDKCILKKAVKLK